MKRISTALAMCAMLTLSAGAQTPQQSFQEFRKGLHKNYQDFRSRILQHYDDFLNGEWHPYEPMDMPGKYSEPKPEKAPRRPASAPRTPDVKLPAPVINPAPVKLPATPDLTKLAKPTKPFADTPKLADKPADTPKLADTPKGYSGESVSATAQDEFSFYDMTIAVPKIEFNILNAVSSHRDTPAQWKALESGDAVKAARMLKEKADEMGLNGYLTYLLASDYVDSKFRNANSAARMCVVHYLLANMGYDVRLAMAADNTPLLLMPFAQKVYSSVYLTVDGKNYTVFAPKGKDIQTLMSGNIYTCQLPKGEDLGKMADLRIDGLRLPYSPYEFEIKSDELTLRGTTNKNLYNLLYRYPQMPTEDFASSTLDSELRKSLVKQVKDQLAGKSQEEAVNTLMKFFHTALPYATDEERHGFEKPYFLEETLYYDKCDCEDRAIMFTWLLWNALGVENHLIAYPMHESAAVHLDTPGNGYSYSYGGETFWSADPTYIGSKVGDVMPQFSTTAPKIDKEYKKGK